MALKHIILLVVMYAGVAVAQPTIFVTTNNHNTLNPETDALSGPAGSFMITHTVTDGVDPLSFEYLQSPIILKSVRQVDAFTNLFASAFVTNDPGTVRWYITNLNAGVYTLDSDVVIGGDTIKIFWRYLTVTNAASATIINITNSVTGATIASGAVQVAVTVTQSIATASMSLVPLVASNGAIGTQSYPWGEINVVTGRFDTLSISNLNVAGAISAVDTSKVPLIGGVMTGGLTNRSASGFVGNGAGLTNVPVSLALSIVTNGSGNVVTNLSVGGMVVTQQLGTVSGGSAAFQYIGGYTYTGGEASVTFGWTSRYDVVTVSLSGDLTAGDVHTGGAGGNGVLWSVQLNGIGAGAYRGFFRYDSLADAVPATAENTALLTNVLRLMYVPMTNENYMAYVNNNIAGQWWFIPSDRGVHVSGSGRSYYANYFNYSFEYIGQMRTNEFVNRNAITQMVFGIYNQTNGAQYTARSNAIIRIWGMKDG